MTPQTALIGCTALVIGILAIDVKECGARSATWIPLFWLAVIASRPIGAWFIPSQSSFAGTWSSVEDGSPIDRAVLTVVMIIGLGILARRGSRWRRIIRLNPIVVAFFLYCAVSVIWSDFALIALKRWFRGIGSLIMVLVVLSEDDPESAVVSLVRRCSYILIPLSIVLIKYYRLLGVAYNQWTGQEALSGVTTDKNALGRLCLLAGLFVVFDIVRRRRQQSAKGVAYLGGTAIRLTILGMAVWLLKESNSVTSLFTLAAGSATLLACEVRTIQKHALTAVFVSAMTALLIFSTIGSSLPEQAVASVGRNMTLTDRTFVWRAILDMHTNPIIGVGYDSFWLGDRLSQMIREYEVQEAHNGYLEVYIELGCVGVMLFLIWLLSAFWHTSLAMATGDETARLKLAVLIVFVLYNITEAAYNPVTLMGFAFVMLTLKTKPVELPGMAEVPLKALSLSRDDGFAKSSSHSRVKITVRDRQHFRVR